ncbi:hypothetical protein [Streptomyces sp. A012304]|uniref:hypothetical protein n=1 Tax=Streptomyces sp. A012304 TaxID=375446 RepID=UPI00222F19F3|nr:hypothetical protein [Streptomyces sp. A012304]
MSGRPAVWWGDLVKAVAALDADEERAREIAALLGLDPVPLPLPPVPSTGWREEYEPLPPLAPAPALPGPPTATRPERGGGGESPVPADTFPPLRQLSEGTTPAVDWGGTPSLPERTPVDPSRRRPPEPLLPPRAAPAVLRSALATRTSVGGPPDIGALVQAVARGVACRELPRVPRTTLRFGVQVLVDLGDGMAAFADDQEAIVEQLEGLIGAEHLDVRYFSDCPSRGAGPGDRATWRGYRPPARGTRVLLLSDLGLAGRSRRLHAASVREWRDFLGVVHTARCTAVALVPFPASRVPGRLRTRLAVLTWDRRTTATAVAAELKRTRTGP